MTDPRLFDLVAQLVRDGSSGTLPPLEHYLPRFPGLEAEVEREYRDRVERSRAPVAGPPPESIQQLLERLARHPSRPGRYGDRHEVGRGGMGIVHRTFDVDLRRSIAMKTVRHSNERSLAAFLDEAQITGQLDHPGIVPIHELGVDEHGHPFFTMRLVKGRTLAELFQRVEAGDAEWTQTRALGALNRVCEAMAFAHSKGVIHRDLKPANVMCGEFGEVYVVDWGLARVLGSPAGKPSPHDGAPASAPGSVRTTRIDELASTPESPLATREGDVVGTPHYMPPEQASGDLESLGPRSDVYSVGAILYQLLCGRAPYASSGDRESRIPVVMRVLAGPPPALTQVRPGIPAELVAICERAMARDPADRYADMSAMAHDLRAFLEERVVAAYRVGAWQEFKKWCARNRATASLAGVVVVLMIGVIVALGMAVRDRDARLAAEAEALASTKLAVATNQTSKEQSEPSLRAGLLRSLLQDQLDHRALRADIADELAMLGPGEAAGAAVRGRAAKLEQERRVWASYPKILRVNARNEAERVHSALPSRFESGIEEAGAEEVVRLVEDLCVGAGEAWSTCLARARWRLELLRASRQRVQGAVFPNVESRDDHDSLTAFIHELSETCASDRAIGIAPLLEVPPPAEAALVPLGVDPRTGLPEFVVPATGTIPARGPEGRLALGEHTGLILVRVPAIPERGLAGFYCAKHELTLGQWMRAGNPPDVRTIETWKSLTIQQRRAALGSPVVDIDWDEAVISLRRVGLQLCSEAQWNAVRAIGRSPEQSSVVPEVAVSVLLPDDLALELSILVLPRDLTENRLGLAGLDAPPSEWSRDVWRFGSTASAAERTDAPRVVCRPGGDPGAEPRRDAAARSTRSRELGIRAVRPLEP